jgi:signal peptidase
MREIPYRRIAIVLGVLVVLAVVIPLAVFTFPQVVGADHSYVVISSSMEPTFDAGAVVLVKSVPAKSIETGDIVTYYAEGSGIIENGQAELVTHRVIEVIETEDTLMFRTQGDANDAPDPQPVVAEAVTGRVTFSIPYLGHLIAFMTTDLGYVAFIGVPLGLLILSELWDLARAFRRDRAASTEADTATTREDADD